MPRCENDRAGCDWNSRWATRCCSTSTDSDLRSVAVSMNVRISSAKRSGSQPPISTFGAALLAEQLAEQAAAAPLLHVRRRRCELRNGVRLDVLRAGERAQVGDELLLVARREKRGQQDDVGDAGRQRRDRGVARVDDHEIRAHLSRTMRLRMVA